METDLIFLQGLTLMIATQGRIMTRKYISSLGPRLFLLEMLSTFQLCSCFNILRPLTELEPKPQLYLGHLYSFAALHFYLTQNENTSNPATILVYILRKGISMKLGTLKIVAQFIGAFLAMFYQNVLWAVRTSTLLSNPHICSHPLQTDLFKAFCTELITSFLFQLAALKSQLQELRVRANVLALAISSLMYAASSRAVPSCRGESHECGRLAPGPPVAVLEPPPPPPPLGSPIGKKLQPLSLSLSSSKNRGSPSSARSRRRSRSWEAKGGEEEARSPSRPPFPGPASLQEQFRKALHFRQPGAGPPPWPFLGRQLWEKQARLWPWAAASLLLGGSVWVFV
ncbi:aquaporin-11-like [Sceloporus undulatus]|uniref:aquaporin-11-like n=1 Tax=Sceloporus undulatus TaxID=8520 RepID=UPI001C4A95B6|nr:aquaporin-11-like [Sceloporus undulatus]